MSAHVNSNNPKCRFCSSTDVVKFGFRRNLSGRKQRWKCKKCDKTFTPDDGFLWRHHNKEIIVEAVSLYQRGLSISDTTDHLWQHHGAKIHDTTILRWDTAYSKKLKKYVDSFKPTIKGNAHMDEVVVKVKKKKHWRWGSKDSETKFKILGNLTKRRLYKGGAEPVFRKLRYKCNGLPPRIVTDKLGHYKKGYNAYFYKLRKKVKLSHGVPIACKKYGLKHNNNCAERDNERVKQRYKTMRGFGSQEGGEAFLDLHDIYHNFIKPNMGLGGGFPSEEADIHLPLGRNRLMDLINLAANS